MVANGSIPDAWEDDWETLADRESAEAPSRLAQETPLTKAERLARHAEANRKIWESA